MLAICMAALAATASAASPRVVRTSPANGAKGVALDVGAVEIVFDQEMAARGHSICTVPGAKFPPLRLKGSPWRDARTYVLTLNPLAPETTYTVQLNSPQKQGFRSAAGAPLPVTRITFSTGQGAGTGMMPFPMMPAKPAWRIINVADDFLRYHDTCKAMLSIARAASWDAVLEQKHPALFNDAIYRKKQGAERTRFKQWCIDSFWKDVAPKIEAIRKLSAAVPRQIAETVAAFQKVLPDYKPSTDFYVTISFTFRGKVVDVGGKNVFGIGLDRLDPAKPLEVPITIAHELFHLYHFKTFRPSGGLYRPLWAEGLATYASAAVVPGHRDSTYLGFSGEKMNRCAALLPRMARELRAKMGASDPGLQRIYFGAEANATQIPPEAGYYVGLQIAKSLAKARSLRGLARIDAKAVYPLLVQELDRLAAKR